MTSAAANPNGGGWCAVCGEPEAGEQQRGYHEYGPAADHDYAPGYTVEHEERAEEWRRAHTFGAAYGLTGRYTAERRG